MVSMMPQKHFVIHTWKKGLDDLAARVARNGFQVGSLIWAMSG